MNLQAWEILAVIGVVFIILEIFTVTFYLLPIGFAFLLTSIVATQTTSTLNLVGAFAIFCMINLGVFRKFVEGQQKKNAMLTNFEAIVGKEAEVTEAIVKSETGYVKLYGDTWKAYSKYGNDFAIGDKVIIVAVDGNKVGVDSIN